MTSRYAFSFFLLFISLPLFFNSFSIAINIPHYPHALLFFT